ncbi:MAG: cytochrome c family protein [Rhodospirillaceae bacterium]
MRKVLVLAAMLLPVSFAGATAAEVKGDPELGKKQFAPCSACHTVEKGGVNKIGPNLHGVIGKKSGTNRADYAYSNAMKNAGIIWSEEELMKYLVKPMDYVKGTKMPFVGVPNEQVRANIVAYVVQATKE